MECAKDALAIRERPGGSRFPSGFTIVELLVVIAIIGSLLGLLLPAVQAAREAARSAQCRNNLKQLALACHNFESANRGLPLLYSSSTQLGWITQILPYFEQGNVANQYNLNQPWFDASNAAVVSQRMAVLECPSSPSPRVFTATDNGFKNQSPNALTTFTVAGTDYFAIAGASSTKTVKAPSTVPAGYFAAYPEALAATNLSGAFGPQGTTPTSRRLGDISDGLSNTVMLSEMAGRPYLYLAGGQRISAANFPSYVSTGSVDASRDIPLNYGWGGWPHNNNFNVGTWSSDGTMQGGTGTINCSNYRGIFSFHSAGAYAAFADGSVHLLYREISPEVFFALVTARGCEVVPQDWL